MVQILKKNRSLDQEEFEPVQVSHLSVHCAFGTMNRFKRSSYRFMEVFEAKSQDDQETFEPIGESHLSVGHAAEEDRMHTEPVGEAKQFSLNRRTNQPVGSSSVNAHEPVGCASGRKS